MIEFIPVRPDMLTAKYWHSEAGEKALKEGYEWYSKNYYENLGKSFCSQQEAESQALLQGVYMAMINLQSHCQNEERKGLS